MKLWIVILIVATAFIISFQFTNTKTIVSVMEQVSNTTEIQVPQEVVPSVDKPIYSEASLEAKIHDLVNLMREQNDLPVVQYNFTLANIAKLHSIDMVQKKYFDHFDPDGAGPQARGLRAGIIDCGMVAEYMDYNNRLAKFELKQNQNNQKIRELNQKIEQYENKNKEFEKLQTYYNTFRQNDQLAYYDLVRQYEALQQEYNDIVKQQKQLQQIDIELDEQHRELEQLYNMLDGKVVKGPGENLAKSYLYESYTSNGLVTTYNWQTEDELAQQIVDGWMQSPGHRENILIPYWTSEGIGVEISGNEVYVTQEFC